MMYELRNKKIFVAGDRGMVGSAIKRALINLDENITIVTTPRSETDLQDNRAVKQFFEENRPDVVVLAAAKVGGILANSEYPVSFLKDNLEIQNNVISNAHEHNVEKLLFLGSSCIYPKFADQPIQERSLLTGSLEETNEWYAIAKIAGIKLCQAYRKQFGRDFISAMPTNLYGFNDNFDLQTSHVLPALIRKMHEAKIANNKIEVWGTGKPKREFLHVDDLANACIFLLKNYSDINHINIGVGEDLSIAELVNIISDVVGFNNEIYFNDDYPDGTPRKLLDVSKLKSMGWKPNISLKDGIKSTYEWYLSTL